ncbi:hypothetical protein FRC03_010221 [Tulasnella sp. 419]|nr:hypothetical protein FRC03_010221 [Tulasnella sp. 419]
MWGPARLRDVVMLLTSKRSLTSGSFDVSAGHACCYYMTRLSSGSVIPARDFGIVANTVPHDLLSLAPPCWFKHSHMKLKIFSTMLWSAIAVDSINASKGIDRKAGTSIDQAKWKTRGKILKFCKTSSRFLQRHLLQQD